MGIEEVGARIIAETDALREKYRLAYAKDPDAELLAWLLIAVQREAMVSFLYERTQSDRRFKSAKGPAAEVARDAVTLIWQQESSHTAEVAARVVDGVFLKGGGSLEATVAKVKGTVDAKMLHLLTDPKGGVQSALAKAATWLASKLAPEKVPAFVNELAKANLREYFLLARALERTAKDSYARVEQILPKIAASSASLQPAGLIKPVRNTKLDEAFHERAFHEMTSWLEDDGTFKTGLDGTACMQKLKTILLDTTGVNALSGRPGVPVVSSAGGLDELFKKHNIEIKVLEEAA
jgi:hypothetical protein